MPYRKAFLPQHLQLADKYKENTHTRTDNQNITGLQLLFEILRIFLCFHYLFLTAVLGTKVVSQKCSVKKFLKNFPKFTAKHLRRRLFFDKIACLRLTTSARDSGTDVFLWTFRNFWECFFIEHHRCLLLWVVVPVNNIDHLPITLWYEEIYNFSRSVWMCNSNLLLV